MSAAVLRATADMLASLATLAEESEAIMAEARAELAEAKKNQVPEVYVPRPRHYLECVDDEGSKPLCHARDSRNWGWAKGGYTQDASKVTCKRCLKSMKKLVKVAL